MRARRPKPSAAAASATREMRVTIAELAQGGDGIALAEVDGERRAVFVRHVVPGDDVRVAVDTSRRPARGRVLELVASGPERVAPACAHVERCGGCDWMHLSARGQANAHEALVREALPAAWREHAILAHRALEPLRYRTRARLHVRVSGGRAIVGMHEAGTREPVEVDACVVLDPVIERARLALSSLFEGAHGEGEVHLAAGTPRRGESLAVLDIRWGANLAAACFTRLERGVAEGLWAGARVFCGEVDRPAVVGYPTPWMRGADGEPLRLAPGGFAQAAEGANATLGARVAAQVEAIERSRAGATTRIVELYAGAGNFTVLLARRHVSDGAEGTVIAVESNRTACEAARMNLSARGLAGRVVEADASIYAIPAATDLVVLDPPRTGARAVAEQLAKSKVRNVLYVSCDPATLARDLAILQAAYEPRAIEAFEMFPQTSHVEALVWLERRRGGSTSPGAA